MWLDVATRFHVKQIKMYGYVEVIINITVMVKKPQL